MHVLLVEDDQMVIKATQMFFRVRCPDIKLEVAENGGDALKLAEGQSFDLVLMDYGLPDMSGVDVAMRMREAGNSSTIVGLSGNVGSVTKDDMLTAGIIDAFEKPLNPDKWQKITDIVEKK